MFGRQIFIRWRKTKYNLIPLFTDTKSLNDVFKIMQPVMSSVGQYLHYLRITVIILHSLVTSNITNQQTIAINKMARYNLIFVVLTPTDLKTTNPIIPR